MEQANPGEYPSANGLGAVKRGVALASSLVRPYGKALFVFLASGIPVFR